MGMIERVLGLVFGTGGGNAVTQTLEVFRENAEAGAARDHAARAAALGQYAAEFAHPRKSAFDRFIDGLNRIPRPAMALGTLGLFVAAMSDPVWFASRMEGIALVPEPLWWLLGAIVSFYFGARHQLKGQEFQKSLAQTMAAAQQIKARAPQEPEPQEPTPQEPEPGESPVQAVTPKPALRAFPKNAALEDWRLNQVVLGK